MGHLLKDTHFVRSGTFHLSYFHQGLQKTFVQLLRVYGNMVGGKREDNPIATITSSNIFSALEKKKKSKKPKDTAGKKDGKKAKADTPPAPELWQAAPIQVASWADCEDDDDFGGLGPVPQWGNDVNKVAQDVDEHKVSVGI